MQDLIKNKKGLSEVVTTLALVGLAVVAVAIAGFSVLRAIESKANIQESPEYNCLNLQLDAVPAIEITNACLNTETKEFEVTVKRSAIKEIYISSLKFTLHSTIPESAWLCADSCGDCTIPSQGSSKTYFFTNSNQDNPENPDTIKSVKVYLSECELDTKNIVEC